MYKVVLTKKEYKTLIEKNNKAFTKMNKQRKAVYLAKDVLKQLEENKYIANTGNWCKFEVTEENKLKKFNSFEVQQEITNCQVCGLGSLICSLIKIKDNVNAIEFKYNTLDLIRERLINVFSIEELSAIEIAFEGGCGIVYVSSDFNEYRLITNIFRSSSMVDFSLLTYKYLITSKIWLGNKHPTERLKAIMENIIANKGHFKPNGVYYK